MDAQTLSVLLGIATNYFTDFTTPVIQNFFAKVFQIKPSLEADLKNAKTSHDFEKVFKDAVGVIDGQAGIGSIQVDHSFLLALRGIRFDHQNGLVTIFRSKLEAPILQTGGTGSGETKITDSTLKSQGTEIKIGNLAQIRVTGNAQVRQS